MKNRLRLNALNRIKNVTRFVRLRHEESRAGVHRGPVAFSEIVVNGNLMPRVQQFFGAYGTDIARPARHKNVHAATVSGGHIGHNGKNPGVWTDTSAGNHSFYFALAWLMKEARLVKLLQLILLVLTSGLYIGYGEVKLGNEVLAENRFRSLRGKRIGLITNPSGVNRNLQSTIEILRHGKGVNLAALFGPEHGIYGDIPAGNAVESHVDVRTGLPVHSLYGATRKPSAQMLTGLDALVYDLQDTGCRSYTFISTMGLAMEACADSGSEFIVLDRPNPLGGLRVEGPPVEPAFRSFVSQWNVPYVYGMTCGELARMINGEHWITNSCKLTVVSMKGWKRSMTWRDTGLPWVPTSPHVPYGDSPLYQVATGMLGEIGGGAT